MKLAAWLFLPIGAAIAILVAITLVMGGLRARRAVREMGDSEQIVKLFTFDAAVRRGFKGVLLCLALLAAFFAAARPQYGKGTRLVPATNLDIVLVLDFSKSMYARDVEPSRIFRAKTELARLVKQLRGARFGAVAFSGEPMAFPLTADGAAVAQFLRQLEPNDMPVPGTAIGRALRAGRQLLERDPLSADHKRVLVLITDGEDLEGNPLQVAENIAKDGTTIHVVQIGGLSPEPIPIIGDDGEIAGWQTDKSGKRITTSLTPEGEEQLKGIAAASSDGRFIRAEKGTTGIDQVVTELRQQMKGELSERVENVYADVYFYPLALALLLLLVEIFVPEAPRRARAKLEEASGAG